LQLVEQSMQYFRHRAFLPPQQLKLHLIFGRPLRKHTYSLI